ncbi:Dynein heavy chain 1, axonemal [Melia azedarach]|uniref:Dynein heavy chain 1, axonemal n=1 Tax=Melia azedarach TaxID=155640 RepID=A0ACC1Z167_MELAZ|nr:Dynein heavy chain 1, axonemal [Melia azedarach]
MEANRKRRGFIKGKLMPFYRVASKSSPTVQYSSKVKPNQSSPAAASVGYVIAQPKPKVSFIVPTHDNNNNNNNNNRDKLSQLEKLYGVVGDESVDSKAASYISSVQERFKLERVN